MKTFMKQFGAQLGKDTLTGVKIVSVGTLGLAGNILMLANSSIVGMSNAGIKRLKGKPSKFSVELRKVHDIQRVAEQVVDGRVTLREAYDSLAPEQFKQVLDFIRNPYASVAMDIKNAQE